MRVRTAPCSHFHYPLLQAFTEAFPKNVAIIIPDADMEVAIKE